MTLKNVVEALLIAAPDGLTIESILKILKQAHAEEQSAETLALENVTAEEVLAVLHTLSGECAARNGGCQLQEVAGKWQYLTTREYAPWVRAMFDQPRPQRLSPAALETLAIIAYRQPISRAEIEAVRGVSVDAIVNNLIERELVKALGRAEGPGKPMLYGTTELFLQRFGLKNLEDLPNREELKRPTQPATPVPLEAQPETDSYTNSTNTPQQ
jgi:segregation and condensation protein B